MSKDRLIKILFFALFVKPVVFIVLGLNIRGREKLPQKGPAILAANHNSHLDTLVLMSLFPLSEIHRVRPVAAADYFLKNKYLAWFSQTCIGIIPLDRSGGTSKDKLFNGCYEALDKQDVLIIFPEGSRGNPEQIGKIKKGLYYLVKDHQDIQVTPVLMHGLGGALPRGEALFVPFNCDVIIDEPLKLSKTSTQYVKQISERFDYLQQFCLTHGCCENDE
jgi:1-acyl-sn-glycerol-3-phosphate acyltransferase